MCYPTSGQLLAVKRSENHVKEFVANFLSTNFGTQTGLLARGDSNVSCCVLTVICDFLTILRRIPSSIILIKCKKTSKRY